MRKSVAMCTYNGEKYLEEQIESILKQTIKIDEIIICDDCSIDNTHELLNKYKNKYPELISIQINKKNLGYIKNFEKAISLCTGDIIFLSDQDDVWIKNKVETIINIFKSNSEIDYVFTDATAIDNENNKLAYNIWDTVNFTKKKQHKFNNGKQIEQLINSFFVTGATMAFKSFAKKFIFPFPEIIFHDYWIALVLNSINSSAGYCLPEPLIKYRIHEKQTLGLPELSVFNNEVSSKLKVIFKSHYEYYKKRITFFSSVRDILDLHKIKNDSYFLLKDLISYYTGRNKMYCSGRKESFSLIINLLKGKYYSKFAYSKIFVIIRDLTEKVLLNKLEKSICQKQ